MNKRSHLLPRQASVPVKRSGAGKLRPRPTLSIVQDGCVLCGGVIRRMDREIYSEHSRCAPCHDALEG